MKKQENWCWLLLFIVTVFGSSFAFNIGYDRAIQDVGHGRVVVEEIKDSQDYKEVEK